MVSKCSAQVKINPITKLNLDFTLCDEVLPSKMTSIKNVDLFYTHSRKYYAKKSHALHLHGTSNETLMI